MRRRQFIALLGGAVVTWSSAAIAQPTSRVRRIGVLIGIAESDPEAQARITAFGDALRKLGWRDGHNVRIDYRWGNGEIDRIRTYAAELVGLIPDAILVSGTTALAALQHETRSIPIVFVQVADPVGSGFVASLERPNGNITGFTNFEYALGGKWLELLKEAAPNITRVMVIRNPATVSTTTHMMRAIETVAPSFRLQLNPVGVIDAAEIQHSIEVFAREPNLGLIVLPGVIATVHRELIVALAAQYRLPAVYPYRFFATSGGLMSYGVNNLDLYRRAASYVDRILRGENPRDLPVQVPNKFELVINLKTARALSLAIPPSLLARADEVIE